MRLKHAVEAQASGAVKNCPFVGAAINEFSFLLSIDNFFESINADAINACAVVAVDVILNLCKLL